jgi:patatin-like phospholipase/acyl hydrolase
VPPCEKFDLIYGTSTGAIIAALLGLGKSVDEALATEVFAELKFDAFKTDMGIVGTRWKEERPIIFKNDLSEAIYGRPQANVS